MKEVFALSSIVAVFAMIVSMIAAYVTHIAWLITGAMNGEIDTIGEGALGVMGTLFPPIGTIHGFVIWFT